MSKKKKTAPSKQNEKNMERKKEVHAMNSISNKIALLWLIHDFHQTDPEKMHYKVLRDRARYLKNTEEGIKEMCSFFDEIREDGNNEARHEMAEIMLMKSFSHSDIAEITGIDIAEVEKLAIEVRDNPRYLIKRDEENDSTIDELIEEGKEVARYEIAEVMLTKNFSYSDIAEITGFDIAEIEELAMEEREKNSYKTD